MDSGCDMQMESVDANPSWISNVLKGTLIVSLVVMMFNLIIAVPTGLHEIDAMVTNSTFQSNSQMSQINLESYLKEILVIHLGINLSIVISAIGGVLMEKSNLLIVVTVLMTIQAISSFFFVIFTPVILIAIALNILITIMMASFAFLCVRREKVLSQRF